MTIKYQIFIFEMAEEPLEHCFKHAKTLLVYTGIYWQAYCIYVTN